MLYNPGMISKADGPLISVVIPNYNGAAYLETCLRSLTRQTHPQIDLVLVDNGSDDGSLETVRRMTPHATILPLRSNLGFAAAVNRGIKAAQGEWIAVLNNDTEVAADWLAECAGAIARHPDASFFACRILDYNSRERLYGAGDCFLRAGIGYRRGQEQPDGTEYGSEVPIFAACGCAALYRKVTLAAGQGYDEQFFAYMEDVDLGLRLQASGARGYYVPSARIFHMGGATSGGEFSPLAVRLRTRNAILLLLKSVPGSILWRCLPMIMIAQAFWLGRVLAHGRLLSYLRGLAGIIPLVRSMLERRRDLRRLWKNSDRRLWHAILESEDMARRDYVQSGRGTSRFLAWYFRLF
jgi:GT2 family glycosyltransferase